MVFGTHCSKIDWFSGIYGTHANEVTVMKVHIEEKIVNSQIFISFFLFLLFNKRKLSLVLFSAASWSLRQL